MLSYINIKDFALIKELELDLQPNMTALTGETGAGKSIIIDTLELAFGGRGETNWIRPGADRCEITVMFNITAIPQARQWLIEQELDSEEEECIIRRIIAADGRSKSSINDHPCAQQTLRTLGSFIVDIHGQHEHQALLNNERQRELLDAFANHKELVARVKRLYFNWLEAKKKLIELENLTEDQATKVEFIKYQLQELQGVDLLPETIENLHAEQKLLNSSEQVTANLNNALQALTEDDASSILRGLYGVKSQLEKCHQLDTKFTNAVELVQNAIIQTEEAAAEVRHHLDNIELNIERQQQVEQQLSHIYDLARKHQVTPAELNQVKITLEQQLEELNSASAQQAKIAAEVAELEKQYLETATELSQKRTKAATSLSQLITEKMQLLAMEGGKFAVNFLPNAAQTFSASGLERVEFLVTANPGQPLQPLNKVASGGELSRISLAIQVITAEKEVTPTLIFDEVDTGIGGKTADIVGQLLRKLGEKTQVLCVTHLPQVSVHCHHHIVVTKKTLAKTAEIHVTTLDKNERVQEIARMLGGSKITKQTLAHAAEMLNMVT